MENMTKERAAELAKQAAEKIRAERSGVKGNKETAMADAVAKALCVFAEQDAEFAEAIVGAKKTFAECMTDVAKGVGNSISDLDAYKRAVQFYFPGAQIKFEMQLRVNPFDVVDAGVNPKAKPEIKTMSLMDILGRG